MRRPARRRMSATTPATSSLESMPSPDTSPPVPQPTGRGPSNESRPGSPGARWGEPPSGRLPCETRTSRPHTRWPRRLRPATPASGTRTRSDPSEARPPMCGGRRVLCRRVSGAATRPARGSCPSPARSRDRLEVVPVVERRLARGEYHDSGLSRNVLLGGRGVVDVGMRRRPGPSRWQVKKYIAESFWLLHMMPTLLASNATAEEMSSDLRLDVPAAGSTNSVVQVRSAPSRLWLTMTLCPGMARRQWRSKTASMVTQMPPSRRHGAHVLAPSSVPTP